jgi:Amt family ammonium transporter
MDKADTVWMMVSTLLVIMMTVPGLAMFYSGLVQKKGMLAIAMQVFVACAIVSLLWVVIGYSLAFTDGNDFIGGLGKMFLKGVKIDSLKGTIPENTFMLFQMAFAIITPALIVGAFADRMKFSAVMIFMAIWTIVIYSPIAHQVWGGGWLGNLGILDFAGGTVIHVNAGIAGLCAAVMLGPRVGYDPTGHNEQFAPTNLLISLLGVGILWVGWFGFNAGSALTAGTSAANAMVTTQVATAAAALAWMFVEWAKSGKPSSMGFGCGAVAGLVAITPAAGFVDAMGAIAIGIAAGIICYFGSTSLKRRVKYDDSLDVVGVHGIGGVVGAILTGVFAIKSIGGTAGGIEGNWGQVLIQCIGVITTLGWSGLGSYVILKAIDLTIGLRVSPQVELEGLDKHLHGESIH